MVKYEKIWWKKKCKVKNKCKDKPEKLLTKLINKAVFP